MIINKTQPNFLQELQSENIQKKILAILESYDALRYRPKVEDELEKLLKGVFDRFDLSYRLHIAIDLPLEKTNELSKEMYNSIIMPIQEKINSGGGQIGSVIPQGSVHATRKIINLKDIFEADGDTDENAIEEEVPQEIQDWKNEIAKIRTHEKEFEKKATNKILASISVDIPDERNKKLSDIISSRIKNIRDAVDTRLALSRPTQEGGLGLSDKDASEVSLVIEKNIAYVLIDDVITTGVTIAEAARTLKDAGAKHVWAMTIARG